MERYWKSTQKRKIIRNPRIVTGTKVDVAVVVDVVVMVVANQVLEEDAPTDAVVVIVVAAAVEMDAANEVEEDVLVDAAIAVVVAAVVVHVEEDADSTTTTKI